MPELGAALRVFDRVVERSARQPYRTGGCMHTRGLKSGHHRIKAPAFLPEQRVGRQAEVVEVEFERFPSEVADFSDRRAGDARGKCPALLLDQELTDTDVAALGICWW